MQNLVTLALLLALHLPAHAQASGLVCRIRYTRSGKPWCECRTEHGRWAPYPMFACRITR